MVAVNVNIRTTKSLRLVSNGLGWPSTAAPEEIKTHSYL
jgi:hypothetical protein